MDTVFAIPELHDAIFLHVPPQDLLLSAQRVCKHWQTIITTSPLLQRTLFFLPGPRRNRHRDDTSLSPQLRSRMINPFSKVISLAHPSSPPFAYPRASWRKMLVTETPVPMYLYQHPMAFGNADRLFLSEVCDANDSRFTGQRMDGLTFGDIETLAYGRKAHVVVFCYGIVVWTKAAFQCAIDRGS
jgi:hypothetical protein